MGTKQELITNLEGAIALGKTNLAAGGVDTTNIHSVYGVVKAIPNVEGTPAKELISIAVTTPPATTTFAKGGVFSSDGMIVTAYYADKTTADVTTSVTTSTPSMNVVGMQPVTVTYEGKTDTFDITVRDYSITSIAVTTPPTKTAYEIGETLDTTGMIVTAFRADGISYQLSQYTTSTVDFSIAGTKTVTIAANGKTTTFNIVVKSNPLNMVFANTSPTDTTKIWIKDSQPQNIVIKNDTSDKFEQTEILPTSLSESLYQISSCTIGTKCYLFGGFGTYGAKNTISIFDTTDNSLTTLTTPTLTKPLSNISCCAVGTKCYLFGGVTGNGDWVDTISVFDTTDNSLTDLTTPTLLTAAYDIASCVVGTKCYLFGGEGLSGTLDSVSVFDTETNTITALSTPIPAHIRGFSCCSVGTKCYLFGGTRLDPGYSAIPQSYIFNTETEAFTPIDTTTIYPSRDYVTVCVIGTKCYLFGGMKNGRTTTYYNKIDVFDTVTNTRYASPNTLPTTRAYSGGCVVGEKCYLFGGISNNGYLNTIYEFTPTFSLNNNTLYIKTNTESNSLQHFDLTTETPKINVGIEAIYKGNSNNKAEYCESYYYDNNYSNWELIY